MIKVILIEHILAVYGFLKACGCHYFVETARLQFKSWQGQRLFKAWACIPFTQEAAEIIGMFFDAIRRDVARLNRKR